MTLESCVICEQFKCSSCAHLAMGLFCIRAGKAEILATKGCEASEAADAHMPGIPQLVSQSRAYPAEQWHPYTVAVIFLLWAVNELSSPHNSWLRIVFDTWLIKPGIFAFPFHSDALAKGVFQIICVSSEFSSRAAISPRVSGLEERENIWGGSRLLNSWFSS